ncbi:hypothetical protein OTUT144_0976 [Orientia tsutsugamushi str. UT144]|uniref:Uncharacterized protein n=1 Tax=Orientia tsutsugamushi str. UT144 TaxID=1441384 RepID=A0A0F3RLP7_ORITS|nr:hypothetical protein OTUT144_0976 [Orientia tsutsugamushi str. UT144]
MGNLCDETLITTSPNEVERQIADMKVASSNIEQYC